MAFTTGRDSADVVSEINLTPRVDVMLVLMVVFILTAPLLNHAVRINLPKRRPPRPTVQQQKGAELRPHAMVGEQRSDGKTVPDPMLAWRAIGADDTFHKELRCWSWYNYQVSMCQHRLGRKAQFLPTGFLLKNNGRLPCL